MSSQPKLNVARQLALLSCAMLSAGCAGFHIDPSGQRLFTSDVPCAGAQPACAPPVLAVPQPVAFEAAPIVAIPAPPAFAQCAVTQCGTSQWATAPPSCAPPVMVAPQPVVPVIPVSAPCGTPTCPAPAPIANPPPVQPCDLAATPKNRLLVCATQLVAPVGSEVIITAGICGADGYLVMREPLEWMVAQDGVGQIVCVGKESPAGVSHLLRGSPDKLTPNYALAHTSTIDQTITRGTPTPTDDVCLRRGQSYISVTSPSEGQMHVVVLAPKECAWAERKQTVTINWVNAKWTTPQSAGCKVGQSHVLTTKVMRDNGSPAAGWIVRYEALDGPELGFGPGLERAIEVPTNAEGIASAELSPRVQAAGIATIRTQIIRPEIAASRTPQMVVGQAVSSINYSSPGLAMRALGPSVVNADGAVSYRLEVSNTGDQPTRDVTLSFTPPPGLTILNASPSPQAFGQRSEWRMTELAPRQSEVIEVNCRASREADLRATFRVRSAEGLSAEDVVATHVFESSLAVKMSGPDAIEVGKQAKYRVEVTNTGTTPLANVTISDVFDPGLRHAQGEVSPIVKAIGELGPGESKTLGVSFVVAQAGRQRHRLSVTADGGHTAASSAAVTGLQSTTPAVALEVRPTGPAQLANGKEGAYKVEVTNNGSTTATNVRIVAEFGAALEPTVASGGERRESGATYLAWIVPRVAAGETISRQLNCKPVRGARDQAGVAFTVTADSGVREAAQIATRLESTAIASTVSGPLSIGRTLDVERAKPTSGGAPPLLGPSVGGDGSLAIELAQSSNPGQQGRTTLIIQLQNERAVSDKEIAVTLQLPAGMRVERITGPTDIRGTGSNGRTIDLAPIAEVRAGERLTPYRVELSGGRPGNQTVRVEARSARTPLGVTAEIEANAR